MEETTSAVITEVTQQPSFFEWIGIFFRDGGIFMWVILAVFAYGLIITLWKLSKIRKLDVDGPSFMNELQRYILSNDVQGAIRICSGSEAALPKVLKGGLKRSNQSVEQIQNALDATALEVIPKIEGRINEINIAANISTLFGLLGTIQGLIQAFAAVSSADPAEKGKILALGISTAMNTTALGLISAIVLMVMHTWLTNRSEKVVNEIDEFSVKLMDLIGTKKEGNQPEL